MGMGTKTTKRVAGNLKTSRIWRIASLVELDTTHDEQLYRTIGLTMGMGRRMETGTTISLEGSLPMTLGATRPGSSSQG